VYFQPLNITFVDITLSELIPSISPLFGLQDAIVN